jgi:hypothetical protein
MASSNITLGHSINESLSVGDKVYTVSLSAAAGGFQSGSSIQDLGTVTHIHRESIAQFSLNGSNVAVVPNTITVDVISSRTLGNNAFNQGGGTMLLFSKDNKVNTSRLKGYYAEVKMVNTDTGPSELFSVSSEIQISSK